MDVHADGGVECVRARERRCGGVVVWPFQSFQLFPNQ